MKIEDFLQEQAKEQLDKAKTAVTEGAWFDKIVDDLKASVDNSEVDPQLKVASHDVISKIESNKGKLIGLGINAFTLMVQQIASGKSEKAAETYVQALGSADLIIKAMDRGTLGLIAAKKELDALHDSAWEIIKEIAVAGARHLLPFLVSLV